jgi:hypothetical protein
MRSVLGDCVNRKTHGADSRVADNLLRAGMAAGPGLPTWAAQRSRQLLGYTGRAADIVAATARDPIDAWLPDNFDRDIDRGCMDP